MDCGGCCFPGASTGAPSSQVQALAKQLQLLLDEYVILKLLAVEDSQLVWTVFVDVLCLSHHGNLLDACTLAAVAALQNTKVPVLTMDSNLPRINSASTGLPLRKPSLSASFALLDNWCLLDPTMEEEGTADGCVCYTVSSDGAIAQLQHSGHKITEQELLRLSQLAVNRVGSLHKLLLTSKQ